MRLIDADHFIAEMEKLYHDAGWEDGEVHFSLNDLRGNIDAAKTYEQELPRWIIYHVNPIHPKNIDDLMSPSDFYICPICGGTSNVDTNYCPYCGEKLGKAEEAEEKQVQPEIIRCKDCIHRPIINGPRSIGGFGLRFPDDFKCPCRCDDPYYSWMPNDNWFCGNGEKEEKTNE